MALQKNIQLKNGIELNYWVAQTFLEPKIKMTRVIMCGFLSQEVRDNGADFIQRLTLPWRMDKIHPTGKEVYEFAKSSMIENIEGQETEINQFVDSIDC